MKKLVTILIMSILVMSLCSCGGETATPNAAGKADPAGNGKVLDNGRYSEITAAIPLDPKTLEPYDANTIGRTNYMWNIYEALFDFDDNGALVSSLGKKLETIDDKTYRITLYDCIHDSAGNHITASDVVYSVNWLIGTGNAIKYDYFEDVKAIDDLTVEFHWKNAPSSLADLEFPLARTFVFSQKAWESSNFSTNPIGTGSYTVKSFVTGSTLILEANDKYWALGHKEILDERLDLHRANVQTIKYSVIAEASQAAIALENGTIDYCDYITSAALAKFQKGGSSADQYNINTETGGDYTVIVPNCASPAMGDLNLRLAIWYGIDSNAISTVMGGSFCPLKAMGTSFFSDYDVSWEEESNYITKYDPELAKQYLGKSTYSGQTLALICDTVEGNKNAATMIQTMLLQIGIKTEIKSQQGSVFNTTTGAKEGWDFCVAGVGGSTLVGSFNRLFADSVNTVDGVGYSLGFIKDPKLQSLYEAASADATHDKQHMNEIVKYVVDNGYMYPLVGTSSSRLYAKSISKLYFRENISVTLGCSEYVGAAISHSTPKVALDSISAPPAGESAGTVFVDADGTTYTLLIAADKSWSLDVGGTIYTGDMSFPGEGEGVVVTTPAKEGSPKADFYEPDGVCKWHILSSSAMIPVNRE